MDRLTLFVVLMLIPIGTIIGWAIFLASQGRIVRSAADDRQAKNKRNWDTVRFGGLISLSLASCFWLSSYGRLIVILTVGMMVLFVLPMRILFSELGLTLGPTVKSESNSRS